MIRSLCLAAVTFLITIPSLAQETCGENALEANAAIDASLADIERGATEQAIAHAKQAISVENTCFEAHLTLVRAYFISFDYVEGLEALGISRAFRKQMKTVRTMSPENIEARRMEISYLHSAPGLAGGSQSKARRLIDELEEIDPASAYQARLEIGSGESSEDAIVALLNERPIASPDELESRIELVRTLILTAKNYRDADRELADWDRIALPEEALVESLLLRGSLRILGGFEYEAAEAFLSEFVERRPSLPPSSMEPVSIGYAFLGDARRLNGNTEEARHAYRAALALQPDTSRAIRGLAALN